MRRTISIIKVRKDRNPSYPHLYESEGTYWGDPHKYYGSGGDHYEAVAIANELKWESMLRNQAIVDETLGPSLVNVKSVEHYAEVPDHAEQLSDGSWFWTQYVRDTNEDTKYWIAALVAVVLMVIGFLVVGLMAVF